MRNDPDFREPRLPAVAIWTVTGLLVGVALGVLAGEFLVTVLVGGVIGALVGLYLTRPKDTRSDD